MLRKTLSLALALVMALSLSVTVFAADGDPTPGTPFVIEGTGETVYIDLEIYEVTLPTEGAFDFTLDPQGLTGVDTTDGTVIGDLVGGKVVASEDPIAFINYSAVPVCLTFSYVGVSDKAVFVASEADVEKENTTANNVYLAMTPSSAALTDAVDTDENYAGAEEKAFNVSSTAQAAAFLLQPAEYVVTVADEKYTVAKAEDAAGDGNAVVLTGAVNSKADWSDFVAEENPATISLKVTFTFNKDTAEYDEADYVEGVYGQLKELPTPPGPEFDAAGFIVDGKIASSASVSWNKTPSANLVVPFFANGAKIKSVTWKVSTSSTVAAEHYELVDNTFVLKTTYSGYGGSAGTKTVTITLDDELSSKFTLAVALS